MLSPGNHHNGSRRTSPDDFTLLRKKPQTVFSVCQPWASPLWLAARLLTSGDVEQNLGPPKHNTHSITFTCSICNQLITPKQYSLFCNTHLSLKHWVHKKCTTTTLNDYHPTWTCPLHTQLTTTPPPPNTITTPPLPD